MIVTKVHDILIAYKTRTRKDMLVSKDEPVISCTHTLKLTCVCYQGDILTA